MAQGRTASNRLKALHQQMSLVVSGNDVSEGALAWVQPSLSIFSKEYGTSVISVFIAPGLGDVGLVELVAAVTGRADPSIFLP